MKAELVWIAITSCLLTLAAVWLALNLASGEKKIERQVERLYATDDPQFSARSGRAAGAADPRRQPGRRAAQRRRDLPVDARGDRARLATASPSRPTSTGPATIGREFADALTERARAGVKVHVLLDWVGSAKMDAALISTR